MSQVSGEADNRCLSVGPGEDLFPWYMSGNRPPPLLLFFTMNIIIIIIMLDRSEFLIVKTQTFPPRTLIVRRKNVLIYSIVKIGKPKKWKIIYFDMKDDERNVSMYSICIQCLHQPGWVKGNTLLSTLFITMITIQMIEESATVIN